MRKSAIITNLEELYKDQGNGWVNRNSLLINYARGAGLAVGGSIAMAVSNKRPHKIPGDFDFFTDDNTKALKFIQNIIHFLSSRTNTHYKILINNGTKFNLEGVSHHVRIDVPFWLPICIMTLKTPLRYFFYHGLKVQFFDDVVVAAKKATEIDNKIRVPSDIGDNLLLKNSDIIIDDDIHAPAHEAIQAENVVQPSRIRRDRNGRRLPTVDTTIERQISELPPLPDNMAYIGESTAHSPWGAETIPDIDSRVYPVEHPTETTDPRSYGERTLYTGVGIYNSAIHYIGSTDIAQPSIYDSDGRPFDGYIRLCVDIENSPAVSSNANNIAESFADRFRANIGIQYT